jgi:hypothetical protein
MRPPPTMALATVGRRCPGRRWWPGVVRRRTGGWGTGGGGTCWLEKNRSEARAVGERVHALG